VKMSYPERDHGPVGALLCLALALVILLIV
jgi:hypothetical protein